MHVNIMLRSSVVAGVLAFVPSPAAAVSLQAQPSCPAWEAAPVEHAGLDPVLWGVDGAASNDIWAVGAYYSPVGHAQIQHWDGARWTPVPAGSTTLPVSVLRGVSVIAADDAWAVGLFNRAADGSGPIQPLTEHWDGLAWTVVPAPEASGHSILTDVAAAATDDVWAVGSDSTDAGTMEALILHWDGSAWTRSASGIVTWNHALDAVTVVASDDVWAVGRVHEDGRWTTLVEHWDGTQWSVVPSGSEGGILNGVAAIGPSDVWAVGTATAAPNTVLTLHWDGTSWSTVANGLAAITLEDVATTAGTGEAWAVGTGADLNPITAHWNGQTWTAVPNVTGFTLHAVRTFAPADVWAVGRTLTEALAAHYTDPCAAVGARRP